jgi:hypothetical protein
MSEFLDHFVSSALYSSLSILFTDICRGRKFKWRKSERLCQGPNLTSDLHIVLFHSEVKPGIFSFDLSGLEFLFSIRNQQCLIPEIRAG